MRTKIHRPYDHWLLFFYHTQIKLGWIFIYYLMNILVKKKKPTTAKWTVYRGLYWCLTCQLLISEDFGKIYYRRKSVLATRRRGKNDIICVIYIYYWADSHQITHSAPVLRDSRWILSFFTCRFPSKRLSTVIDDPRTYAKEVKKHFARYDHKKAELIFIYVRINIWYIYIYKVVEGKRGEPIYCVL